MPLQPDDLVPMHPTLKQRILGPGGAAERYRRERADLEREARALVLCPPDCPARDERRPDVHAHTYWDMLRMAQELDYGWQCRKAEEARQDMASMDTGPHLTRAGVRFEHRDMLAKASEDWAAMRGMRLWLGQQRDERGMRWPWLVLAGPSRGGKTLAAVAALEFFIRRHPWGQQAGGGGHQGKPFVMLLGAEFVQLARAARAYSTAGQAHAETEELLRAKVLVLDDVGTERLGPDEVELFQRLVNERHASRRVTIWTANLTPGELQSRLDFAGQDANQAGRLWRRVAESAAVVELSRAGSKVTMGGKATPLPRPQREGVR